MTSAPMTAREIIDLWPSRIGLADDVGATLNNVDIWYYRKRIPARRDVDFIRAARARDLPLTYEILAHSRADGASRPVRQPDGVT